MQHSLTKTVGSPGTGGHWASAGSSRLVKRRGAAGIGDDVEVESSEGRCSTGRSPAESGTSEQASSCPTSRSGSGEEEEERDVVEEVEEVEDWGEVSEEESGGGKDVWSSGCSSDDSSPPAEVEAADVGPGMTPPTSAAPLLCSWYNRFLSFSSRVFIRLSTKSIFGGPSLSDSATEEG